MRTCSTASSETIPMRKFSEAEIAKRDQDIRGRPPRLPALPPEQRSERQQARLDEMKMTAEQLKERLENLRPEDLGKFNI